MYICLTDIIVVSAVERYGMVLYVIYSWLIG